MNMTIKNLKECIEDLPDDMLVIMPIVEKNDSNVIFSFRIARTAGILSSEYESKPAFCLNSSRDGLDIETQLEANKYRLSVECDKLLF